MDVSLKIMTRELCRRLYRGWENDEAIYMDMSRFKPYVYDEAAVDAYFDARQVPTRVMFAVMLGDEPIGGVDLKNIDRDRKTCELSIHMQNDSAKNKGYGTAAERLAVRYAFDNLGLETVFADVVLKNTRSAHVLEKVGFRFIKEEGIFRYYRIDRSSIT